jgi:L-rhamnose-H+ transport protein
MGASLGFSLVILAGIATGVYFVGLKYVEPWKWENIWLAYAVIALVIMPVVLAFATVPNLIEVLGTAPRGDVEHILLYGLGWGIGSVLSGLGVARMGMAIGVSVLIGIDAVVGTFVPMVINTPQIILQGKGLMVIVAVIVLLAGVVVVGIAGKRRERDQAVFEKAIQKGSFAAGLAICIFSGIFSAMMNFAFAFSAPVSAAAVKLGASASSALNAVWLITLLGGFIPNLIYTGYLLRRNETWSNYFLPRTYSAWFVGLGMAALWFVGLLFYGWGANGMGSLGAVIGWPLFMAVLILASTATGFLTGEWKGARIHSKRWMVAGLIVLIIASALLGVANNF